MLLFLWTWSALLSSLGQVRPAFAQLKTLVWSAPSACPPAAAIEGRIAELVEQSGAARTELRVQASIKARGAAPERVYTLILTLDGPDYHASRRLQAQRCASLAEAAAWMIAVALVPGSSEQPDRAPGRATASEEGVPSAVNTSASAARGAASADPRPADASESASDRRRAAAAPPPLSASNAAPSGRSGGSDRPRVLSPRAAGPAWRRWWEAGASAGLSATGLPPAALGVGAHAGLGFGVLLFELRAAFQPARTRALSTGERATFRTQMVGLFACATWGAPLRVAPCLGLELLRSAARVRGVDQATAPSVLWAGLGPSLRVSYDTRRWLTLEGLAGVQLPLSARPRFTIEGLGEVARAWPLSVYARVGFGIRPPAATRLSD